LIAVSSLGYVGKIRLYKAEHCVIETKPDNELGDLRLTDPFPELRKFADSIDLTSLDQLQHGHVPYVVVLIQALDHWRQGNLGKTLPKTREEKDALKAIISKMRRADTEMNFQEALDNAYKAWVPYSIPDGMQKALELNAADSKSEFWITAKAVAQFVRDCGKLPLAGSLPDMTSTTDMYIKLQEIYASRAEGDCAAINAHIASQQKDLGLERTAQPEYVQRFCKNGQYCEVFNFRTIEDECKPCSMEDGGVDLAEEVGDEDSLIQWYLAFRAVDRFRDERGHYPGQLCGDTEAALAGDTAELTKAASRIVDEYKVEGISADPKMLEEMVRYGGCELHTTSSVIGGIASQEAVKLLTKQYSPMCNTMIYDGLNGKTQVLEV